MVYGYKRLRSFFLFCKIRLNMRLNKLLKVTVILISVFGLIMIYSASHIWSEYKFGNPYKYLINQSIFFCMGLLLMNILSKLDYKIYYKHSNKILIICFILLVLVLIPGIGSVRNGSRSWFSLFGFGFQPSEVSKVGLIIFTSKYLAKNEKIMDKFSEGVLPIILVILLFFGVIMLEPDFGSGMVITLTLFVMIFVSKTKMSFFIKVGLVGIVGIIFLILIAPYRIDRIVSFLNPWSDPLGSGFQIIQSLYAIGPGGLLGMGFKKSIQKYFYLPEPQTDFIFSIISEELGFLGVLIVVSAFFIIFLTCMFIFLKTNDLFGKYLVFGLSFGIILQSILNLSVVVGLIPVTGVTLPFLSYGGSSLLVSMASIGIILNVSRSSNT